jgi:hypothetical protein
MQRSGDPIFLQRRGEPFQLAQSDPPKAASVDHLELSGWRVYDGAAVNAIFRESRSPFHRIHGREQRRPPRRLLSTCGVAGPRAQGHGSHSLILDGENAWETFADGGGGFLRALQGIAADARTAA